MSRKKDLLREQSKLIELLGHFYDACSILQTMPEYRERDEYVLTINYCDALSHQIVRLDRRAYGKKSDWYEELKSLNK